MQSLDLASGYKFCEFKISRFYGFLSMGELAGFAKFRRAHKASSKYIG